MPRPAQPVLSFPPDPSRPKIPPGHLPQKVQACGGPQPEAPPHQSGPCRPDRGQRSGPRRGQRPIVPQLPTQKLQKFLMCNVFIYIRFVLFYCYLKSSEYTFRRNSFSLSNNGLNKINSQAFIY